MKMSKMFSTKFNVVVNNNYLCQYMYLHVCMYAKAQIQRDIMILHHCNSTVLYNKCTDKKILSHRWSHMTLLSYVWLKEVGH